MSIRYRLAGNDLCLLDRSVELSPSVDRTWSLRAASTMVSIGRRSREMNCFGPSPDIKNNTMTSSNGFMSISPAQAYSLFDAAFELATEVEAGQKMTGHGVSRL